MRSTIAIGHCGLTLAIVACGGGGGRDSGSASGGGDDGITVTIGSITATDSATGNDSDPSAADDDGPKLDAAQQLDLDVDACAGDSQSGGSGMDDEGEFDFSYIWIANSGEGTMSKMRWATRRVRA
jgi:hypothetical protein